MAEALPAGRSAATGGGAVQTHPLPVRTVNEHATTAGPAPQREVSPLLVPDTPPQLRRLGERPPLLTPASSCRFGCMLPDTAPQPLATGAAWRAAAPGVISPCTDASPLRRLRWTRCATVYRVTPRAGHTCRTYFTTTPTVADGRGERHARECESQKGGWAAAATRCMQLSVFASATSLLRGAGAEAWRGRGAWRARVRPLSPGGAALHGLSIQYV
jgi:hypothetical protein